MRSEVDSPAPQGSSVDPALSLGEGSTPVLRVGARLPELAGGATVWCKAEHLNPTGSYKDRLAARAVTIATRTGLRGLLGTSSGNGGAAAAAYGARAGLPVCILTVPGAPAAKLATATAAGARIIPVEGLGITPKETDRVFAQVLELTKALGLFPFITAWSYSPEMMHGAGEISTELVEQVPGADTVYVPVGGGGLLTSVWRGYQGAPGRTPRIVGVQPLGSATLLRASRGDLTPVERVTTSVSGLQVARLLDPAAAEAVTTTGGHVVEVSDEDVWAAQAALASEGVVVEPAGAVALAGALADVRRGRLTQTDEAVVLATGAGWKDQAALERISGPPAFTTPIAIDGLAHVLERELSR